MNNKQQAILDRFLNETNYDLSFENLTKFVENHNGKVYVQTTGRQPVIDDLLKELGLDGFPEDKNAFSTRNSAGTMLIFLKANLPQAVRLHCLTHEIAHMLLGHDTDNGMYNEAEAEQDANEFVILADESIKQREEEISHLISQNKEERIRRETIDKVKTVAIKELEKQMRKTRIIGCASAAIILLLVVVGGATYYVQRTTKSNDAMPTINIDASDSTDGGQDIFTADPDDFAIVIGGNEYHKPDCQIVKDAQSVIYLSQDAPELKIYKPCAECNPGN